MASVRPADGTTIVRLAIRWRRLERLWLSAEGRTPYAMDEARAALCEALDSRIDGDITTDAPL